MSLDTIFKIIEWERRRAEIFAREEEVHQAKLAAIVPPCPPAFRTVEDVRKELGITTRAALLKVDEIAKRHNWPHKAKTKWKLTEAQFQTILATTKK